MSELYNIYTLECEHTVASITKIRQQYPEDTHYIYCPPCRKYSDPRPPLCWRKVVIVRDQLSLSELPNGISFVMPDEILRLQPTVPPARNRPFPYVTARSRQQRR